MVLLNLAFLEELFKFKINLKNNKSLLSLGDFRTMYNIAVGWFGIYAHTIRQIVLICY